MLKKKIFLSYRIYSIKLLWHPGYIGFRTIKDGWFGKIAELKQEPVWAFFYDSLGYWKLGLLQNLTPSLLRVTVFACHLHFLFWRQTRPSHCELLLTWKNLSRGLWQPYLLLAHVCVSQKACPSIEKVTIFGSYANEVFLTSFSIVLKPEHILKNNLKVKHM